MADTNTYDLFQKVEKWTTKEKFNALGPRTIETGTEYNLTGAIDETDLGSDLLAKINSKLTTPTTPTAESAVTLLADGTVGTKPLSEIGGGGGGKLYAHNLRIENSSFSIFNITYLHSSNSVTTDMEEVSRMFNSINYQIGVIDSSDHVCVDVFSLPILNYFKFSDGSTGSFNATSIISHTLTEL